MSTERETRYEAAEREWKEARQAVADAANREHKAYWALVRARHDYIGLPALPAVLRESE